MKHLLLVIALVFSTGMVIQAQNGKGKGQDKAAKAAAKGQDKAAKSMAKGQDKAAKAVAKGQGTDVEIDIAPNSRVDVDVTTKNPNGKVDVVVAPDSRADVDVQAVAKDKENKGNAYGKNKGDLSGKEFGQARAAAAKEKNKTKKAVAKTTIQKADDVVVKAKDKVAATKKQLEEDLASKKISAEEYADKKVKIEAVEKKILEVEAKEQKLKITINE